MGSIQVEGVKGIEAFSINSGSRRGGGKIPLFPLENIMRGNRNYEKAINQLAQWGMMEILLLVIIRYTNNL